MKYQAFTNDTLMMMHHGARGALAVDDELTKLGAEPRFKVRSTSDWKTHVADLETELVRRGMSFEAIDFSDLAPPIPEQPALPSEATLVAEAPVSEDPDSPELAPGADKAPNEDKASGVDSPSIEDKAADQNTRLRNRIAAVIKLRPLAQSSS